jgi:hypothetical protein
LKEEIQAVIDEERVDTSIHVVADGNIIFDGTFDELKTILNNAKKND